MPKVSVIIPVYKTEKYLRECLDSVINQTLRDMEIICVNDGSPDNSLQILEEYAQKDNRIKIINQENQGLSEARNNGIKVANGEYIGFLDSDDYVSLNFYENLYNRGQETEADIVVCEYIFRFKDNDKNRNRVFMQVDTSVVTADVKEKFECLYLPNYCYIMNKIYKRDCLTERFIKGVKWEDVYFTCNVLAKSNTLSVAKNTVYYYRNNPNSIVNDKSNINRYFYHKAFAYFYNFVCENNINIDINRYTKTRKYGLWGLTFLETSDNCFQKRYCLFNYIKLTIRGYKL